MRIGGYRGSGNVQDRRGMGMAAGGLGIGGVVIALIAMFFGVDPAVLNEITQGQPSPQQQQAQRQAPKGPPQDAQGKFVSQVLASTEDTWQAIFRASGRDYPEPTLVLYEGGTRTACGMGQAAMGPFYCPRDQSLYIDLAFFRDLQARFRAPGDFAQAYVIAHEVGHHVQKTLGVMDQLERLRAQGVSRAQYNQASVRVELQADCYAGIWAHHAGQANLLSDGDIEEGLNAAAAIGDDRLQKQTQGRVVPESFTHGSSAQRVRWFKRGLESGRTADCDALRASTL
jgi:predicted metalloprotease